MKYLSLFSGIGGFELGIQQAYDNRQKTNNERGNTKILSERMSNTECDNVERPISCIGFSEIDKYATKVYQHHFPEHKNYGDITKINAEELPDFDFLVGGFPCQAFSIAGKRKGFDDTRGTLFFDIARILRAKQPRLFLLENVKGLLSHDNGNTFKTIIATLDELGYDLQWQVLNSKNHGVPQNRERIFIVGHLRGTSRPEVFPFSGADEKDTRELKYVGQVGETDRVGDNKNLSRNAREGYRIFSDEGLSPTLRSQLGGASRGSQIIQLNTPAHSNDRVYGEDGISPTLNTMQGGNRQPFVAKEMQIRRLTPKECERLQGFPDNWTATENTSDSQRYKMCGNAVTVNVIRDIMQKLLA